MKVEYLSQLIKQLTKNEKRNFNQYRNTNKVQEYYELYDAVNLDDADLSTVKSNSNKNNYLFGKILDSIRIHNSHTVSAEFYTLYQNAEICISKGLYETAHYYILKSFDVCDKYELLEQKISALKLLLYIANNLNLNKFNNTEMNTEIQKCIDLIQINHQYTQLRFEILSIIRGSTRIAKDDLLTKISSYEKEEILTSSFEKLPTFYSKRVFQEIWTMLCFLKRDNKKRIYHTQKTIKLYEENPPFKKTDQETLIAAYSNLLILYAHIENWKGYKIQLEKFNALKINGISQQAKKFQTSIDSELIYVQKKDFSNLDQYIKKCRKKYEKYESVISTEYQMLYYLNFSFANYRIGQLEAAIKLLKQLKQHNWGKTRIDIQQVGEVLWLIFHYSKGSYQLAHQSAKSIIKRHRRLYKLCETEKLLFRFFCSKNIENPTALKHFEMLNNLKFNLKEIIKNSEYERNYNAYFFDFRTWVDKELDKLQSSIFHKCQ